MTWVLLVFIANDFPTGEDTQRCGVNALTICLKMAGIEADTLQLDEWAGKKGSHTSMVDLERAAMHQGASCQAWRWNRPVPSMVLQNSPAVIPVAGPRGEAHFVALVGSEESRYLVLDFPHGCRWVEDRTLREQSHWDGAALHVARSAAEIASVGASAIDSTATLLRRLCIIVVGIVSITLLRWRLLGPRAAHPATTTVRPGFTVLELIVTLSIIGVLVALIAPAVQRSRETARKIDCGQRLHQIGIALEGFEATHQLHVGEQHSRNLGNGQVDRHNSSAQLQLLPYLGLTSVPERFNPQEDGYGVHLDPPTSKFNPELLQTRVAVWECPSEAVDGPRTNYRISNGTSPWMHESPRVPGVVPALQGFRRWQGRRDSSFTDGKSHTTTFCEKLTGDRQPSIFSPDRDMWNVAPWPTALETPADAVLACGSPIPVPVPHYSFGGTAWFLSGVSATWYNHILTPNSRIPDCVDGDPQGHAAVTARSLHGGGVNALFADGAVHFVGEAIDANLWRALGTIAGNEFVSLWE